MSLFSRVKSWFRNEDPDYQDGYFEEASEVLVDEAPVAHAGGVDAGVEYPPAQPATGGMPDYSAEFAPAAAQGTRAQTRGSEASVRIPLAPILAGLPEELRARLLADNVGDASIAIASARLLPQLSRGSASLTFGELRAAARGAFSSSPDLDDRDVTLPLSIVLPRITPDMIARRQASRQFDIPDEIVSPFAEMGRGLTIASVQRGSVATASRIPQEDAAPQPAEPAPVARAPRAMPAAAAPRPAATPAANLAALRAAARSNTTLSPAQPRVAPPRPAEHVPGAGPRPPGPKGMPPVASKPASAAAPRQTAIPMRPPAGPPATPSRPAGVPLSTLPGAQQAKAAPAPAPSAPVPIPAAGLPKPDVAPAARQPIAATGLPLQRPSTPAAPPAVAPGTQASASIPAQGEERAPLMVLMSAVSEFWPGDIKAEVASLNASNTRIGLPFTAVEAGLRKGKLTFSWQQLRSWIRPAVPNQPSAHDTLQLELPLRCVAPLFIAQQKAGPQPQHRVAVDMAIPDLFNGGEEASSQPEEDHVVTRPVDTNFYVWEDEPDVASAARAHLKADADLTETEFLRRATTPNEVVTRAVALEGIEGALIALPDGLLVSSKLPAGVNGDTLAAFLPHLYGKVTQCTQELRMGELNNLKFTVGNVPWKVFRVNALYFAAFGKAGEPLPGAELHALVKELDRKAKD